MELDVVHMFESRSRADVAGCAGVIARSGAIDCAAGRCARASSAETSEPNQATKPTNQTWQMAL